MKVIHDLLDKYQANPKRLSEAECEACKMHVERIERQHKAMKQLNKEIEEDCPTLCSGYEKTVCPAPGWADPIKKLAYKLESLNIQYKKYGQYVNLDQTKEKFGKLRVYEGYHQHPIALFRFLLWPFNYLQRQLFDNLDFGRKTITDRPPYDTLEWCECTEEDYNNRVDSIGNKVKPSSDDGYRVVTSPETTEDGKQIIKTRYFVSYTLGHPVQTHIEITKHKFLFRLMGWLHKLRHQIETLEPDDNAERRVMEAAFEDEVTVAIREAEDECYHHCERCGYNIGKGSYTARCSTIGWISYLCPRCAAASGDTYKMHGDYYKDGVKLPPEEADRHKRPYYNNEPEDKETYKQKDEKDAMSLAWHRVHSRLI